LFPRRGKLIDWIPPLTQNIERAFNAKSHIVFPSSTVGRKGCYELREALRGLNVKLILLGPVIESPDFWAGFEVERINEDWMGRADVVVLPAFVEHRPRRLIAAANAGIPVIASKACGIENVRGVRSIDAGDVATLRQEILAVLAAKLTAIPCFV
jgi:glycosyltransferase involved in cell wall biosynthesis